MEYVYAAMLLSESGKEITDTSINSVLKAAGFTPDEAKAKAVADSLKGVDIKEVVKHAQTMQVSAAPAATAPAHGEAKAKAEPKEDAKSEEEAASGLAGLFG